MTLSSAVSRKIKESCFPVSKTITKSTADTTNPRIDASRSPLPTRSSFPAPMFCPLYGAIVAPIDSTGQLIKELMRCAAVTPATVKEPKPLTAAWMTSVPIAVTEYCSPIGMPI